MKRHWYVAIEQLTLSPRRFRVRAREDQNQKDPSPAEFQVEVDSLGPIRLLLGVLEPQRRSDMQIGSEVFADRKAPVSWS